MKNHLPAGRVLKPLALLFSAALLLAPAPAAEPAKAPAPAPSPTDAQGNFSGQVLETLDAAGYTYLRIETGHQEVWAATTPLAVAKGDKVTVFGAMPMAGFHSKALGRDFDVIYFTGKITNDSGAAVVPALPPGHPDPAGQAAPALPPNHPTLADQPASGAKVDLAGIKKADGGRTVQEIIDGSAQLAGQPVKVRGRVVKSMAMVMGKNWLHIQDGTGNAKGKDNDLTVTSTTAAKLGDTVLVTGQVTTNKDFGAGYRYAVILDDASVTVEGP